MKSREMSDRRITASCMMNPSADIRYIDQPGELVRFCQELSGITWLALDTEFLREKTYYPKPCLIQIATPEHVACIDVVALDDLAPLLDIIYDKRITKVMHAARQDMEIFFHMRAVLPSPVFDTQIAAPLLGFPDQTGYATLVKEILGVTLEKLHTRADWSLRPLSQEQIHYAADDVIYLAEIYRRLTDRLTQHGRLDWLEEDFNQLTSPALYHNLPADAWKRVRGVDRLKGASLSVLQALTGWRERSAQQADRPRNWLVRDDVLIDIARHMPRDMAALGRIRQLHEGMLKRHGKELLALIEEAIQRPPEPLPDAERRTRLSASQEAVVDAMMAVVRICAEKNSLNPSVLATRKQLEHLMSGNPDAEVMHGWRKNMVGNDLQALLNGELGIYVADGTLNLKLTRDMD